MYAVEFDTKIDNGTLVIPKRYKELSQIKEVHVIIMVSDNDYMANTTYKKNKSFSGALKKYANPSLIDNEKDIAWSRATKEHSQNNLPI